MTNRFRTCRSALKRLSLLTGGGALGCVRPGAETPTLIFRLCLSVLLLCSLLCALPALAATPVGTVISNTAVASYGDGPSSGQLSRNSNTVSIATVVPRTPATIQFLSYAPLSPNATAVSVVPGARATGSDPASPLVAEPAPVPAGFTTPIDLSKPVPLAPASVYHCGEPIFVQVTDLDQNLDPAKVETVMVTLTDQSTGQIEIIRLTETGPDTGVFVGYILSAAAGGTPVSYSGTLALGVNSKIQATYRDPLDGTDAVASAALVDPYGIVFDSATGKPLDGVSVTLVNAATGLPAVILGDDGVSTFPATVKTGQVASDTSGKQYAFPPGGFRYPFLNPGSYRFQVTPPAGYGAPSTVADAVLQALPTGPFSLVPGSRLDTFTVNPGPAVHIDIPLDPISAALWLQKTAGKETVAVGDFLSYQLDLQNADAVTTATGITISDTLPPGFRYRSGSAKLNGLPMADPAVSADGRTLTFAVGELPPKGTASVRYVVEVAAGAKLGTAINRAVSQSPGGKGSNLATAAVQVRSDFLATRALIAGELFTGCGADEKAEGVEGVRIFMEDGTYAVTDKNGRYHFEGVTTAGSHVVQLDLDSLPAKYQVIACEENSRFAGTPYSQFVDLQGGTLWRADFHLGLKAQAAGAAGLELVSVLKKAAPGQPADTVEYQVPIHIGSVPVRNLRLTVMLADGLGYRTGTSALNGKAINDPSDRENVLTFDLGEVPANWEGTVRFESFAPLNGKEKELATSALLTFDTPTKKNERTPLAENLLVRKVAEQPQPSAAPVVGAPLAAAGPAAATGEGAKGGLRWRQVTDEKRIGMPEFVLYPHFPTFGAQLSDEDRPMLDELARLLKVLDIEQIEVIGHTDWVRIAPRSRGVYRDNKALSLARAGNIGNYLIRALHLPLAKLVFKGMGESFPVADNRTAEGRSLNRRVEIKVKTARVVQTTHLEAEGSAAVGNGSGKPALAGTGVLAADPGVKPKPVDLSAELTNARDRSGLKSVATVGLRPGEVWSDADASQAESARKEMPAYTAGSLEKMQPQLAWLWPPAGYHPPIPSVKLALQYDPQRSTKVYLNGKELDPVYLDGTVKKSDRAVAVNTWRGVPVVDGDNLFEAVQYDQQGKETASIKRTIHYSTPPVKAELLADKCRLSADGKSAPVIALRLFDKDGHPAREGVVGEYLVDPPYAVRQQGDELQKNAQPNSATEKPKFKVGEDGVVRIELKPTNTAGEAVVRLNLMSGPQEVRAWLKPEYRDWILVGLGEGTVGYNAVSGHMENVREAGVDEHLYDEGRLAFYAKGRVKGEWLLTMAYDSAKGRGESGNSKSLFQTIDPNTYYTLYGDATNQQYDAASSKKLYLKIERDQFYALFGDFDTGLTITELSRYSRRLTGVKAEWHTDKLEGTLFGSDTAQAYARDEIQGDGTSGLYHLSQKNIVLNSDKVTVQVRDRFRSEIIISSNVLNRFTDYSIDYDNGTLFFKEPIHSRDENFNPIFIVAEYETEDTSSKALTYGGRVGAKLLDNTLHTGVSYVHEGQLNGNGNLYGADASYKVAAGTVLKGEFAHTDTDFGGSTRDGNAYLAEVQHQSTKLQGRAYFRDQDNGFGLGQQNGSETGTRKYGADAAYKLSDTLGISSQAYRQYNLATGAVEDIVDGKGTCTAGPYQAHAGLRYAADRLGDGSYKASDQLTMGASWLTLDKKLNLHADHDQSIGGNNNASFPTRTTFGADYKVTPKATLFAQQEFTSGTGANTNTTAVGVKSTPWEGGTLNSTFGQNITENTDRIYALFGLKQTWKLTDKWSADVGVDRSQTLKSSQYHQFNTNVPPASGANEDFTAVSVGSGYSEKSWNWNSRLEYRTATSEDKWNALTSYVAESKDGVGWSGRFQLIDTREADGSSKLSADLRFGAVYRPLSSRWILLDRLDFLYDRQRSSTTALSGGTFGVVSSGDDDNRRVVNNFNANLKTERNQLSLFYGAKYVLETIDNRSYSGYTDLMGAEWRLDLTKAWDLGVRGSLLHSWGVGQLSYSAGPSIGYNVIKNAWVSLGYNLIGFTDKDFSAANYTAQGPFVRFRFKFDQNSVKEAASWLNHQ